MAASCANPAPHQPRPAYLSQLFVEHPKATSADHIESLQPWNITFAAARINS